MNNRILGTLILLCLSTLVFAQKSLPMGMHYQAIARDLDGSAIVDQSMTIKVEMVTIGDNEQVVYEEVHHTISNKFGLLNLTIGQGDNPTGDFAEIPWSDQNVWARISIKNVDDTNFRIITSSKLYSVPYAYYAQEAGVLSDEVTEKTSNAKGGSPSGGATWSLKGNKSSQKHGNPAKLGTTDYNPLVFVTNNIERMRITEDGEIKMQGNIDVGGSAVIRQNLIVFEDVDLNTTGGATNINGPTTIGGPDMNDAIFTGLVQINKTLDVDGATGLHNTLEVDGTTDLNSALSVNNGSATTLSGTLDVTQATGLHNTLTVDGATDLKSSLNVDGITTLNNNFNVSGAKPSNLTGTLNVDGATTLGGPSMNSTTITGILTVNKDFKLKGALDVDGASTFKGQSVFDINVSGNQLNQPSYPVLIKGSKQGLAIDLTPAVAGETQSHRGNNYISFWRDGQQKGRIEGMGRADIDPNGICNLIVSLISSPPPALASLGTTFDPFSKGLPNSITSLLSFNVGALPDFSKGLGLTSVFSTGGLPSLSGGSLPSLSFDPGPSLSAGSFPTLNTGSLPNITDIGKNTLNSILNQGALPGLSFLSIEDFVGFSNPLAPGGAGVGQYCSLISGFNGEVASNPSSAIWSNIKSQLMSSGMYPSDPDNFEAQIFSNYTQDVLQSGITSAAAAVKFSTSLASIVDPEDIFAAGLDLVVEITNLTIYGSYADLNLGVAYESGAGDYAEWLIRSNADERISKGDIVGVIGGSISKEFTNADRFMVVSTSPLLLGNMPDNIMEEKLHEKIAFMGQVPVKVQGQVKVGDYILPSGAGDGLGIAVAPEVMLARDYQRIVGVAWENGNPNKFINLINTAVGVNHNDMAKVVEQMQFTLNHIQAAVKKLDPTYVSHDYEVSQKAYQEMALDYSVSTTHKKNVSNYFSGKAYSNKKEMLDDVKNALASQAGINMAEFPVLNYLFEHPEQAENLTTHYSSILSNMVSFRQDMNDSATK